MSAENPADTVIEAAAPLIAEAIDPFRKWNRMSGSQRDEASRAARALQEAGLLADPAGQDGQCQWKVAADTLADYGEQTSARAERAEAEVDELRATVDRVRALAEGWHNRGEHDMNLSKQLPEDVRDAIYESGCEWVEMARHVRNALDGPHASGALREQDAIRAERWSALDGGEQHE